MLELHIWGPAFGLPSIDAECLAAILYLRHVLPNHVWALVPSNNPNFNPFRKLPALRDDSIWIAGLDQIQQHLSDRSDGTSDLDRHLSDSQRADRDAYTSFLYSKGLPLLDLCFYVSSDNYTGRTRSVLGDLLEWPQSWTIPHQLREQAKRRSEHLGLSALDVDIAQEEDTENTAINPQIPKSLRKPRLTIGGLLGRSSQKTRFRLHAVTSNFLEPLQSKLSGKKWLIADHISSTDCLAVAILTLMDVSKMPQAWLEEALSQKYQALGKWARDTSSKSFGNATPTQSVLKDDCGYSALPWQVPSSHTWFETSMLAMETIVSSVPILRIGYERHETPEHGRCSVRKQEESQQIYARMHGQQRLYSQIVTACIGTTSLLGWMAYVGLSALPRTSVAKPRRNFGEAGALLGL